MSMYMLDSVKDFRERLSTLSRQELLDIIKEQNPSYIKQINRIEYVFKNKLTHINWDNGQPVNGKNLTNEELITLIDPPFIFDKSLARAGFNEDQQRQILIASDPVLWAKSLLDVKPRVYQTLMLRDDNDRKVMRFGRRLGKALDINTPIPTPDGWKTMGSLKQGDRVFDRNGKPCFVTFATDTMYNHKCYNVYFNDGSIIKADAEHLWSVETKHIRKNNARNKHKKLPLVTLTTEQMMENLKVGIKNESNYSIPLAAPLQYVDNDIYLPIHPYVLGFWLGDGTNNTGYVTIGHEDQKESIYNIENCGFNINGIKSNDITFNINGLNKLLRQNQFFNSNKIIPVKYLQSSIEQRFELLKGLMDTDGSVLKDGTLEFSSSYKELAENVYELITSLGIKAHMYQCKSKLNGVEYKDRHRIYFKTNIPVFKLTRKLMRQTIEALPCQQRRYITKIVETDTVPVRCIRVDSEDSLFLAGKTCIPTHNTFSLSVLILWHSYVNPKARILVVAPMKSQVGLIYEEVMNMAEKNKVVLESITRHVTSPQFEIQFSNGSTVRFFTSGMKSNGKTDVARGQEADVIILDEMDYMGPEDLVALLAMLQNTNEEKRVRKMLVGASTPSGQRNTFWKWNTDPDFGFSSFWFPSYVNPGWDKETETRMRMDYPNEQAYRHEVEADWGEDVEGVYPRRFVDIAFQNEWRYAPMVESARSFFVFGVDWDKYGAGVNIVVLEVCNENHENETFAGRIRLAFREEINKGEFTYTAALDRIIELNNIFKPKHIYIDRGAGEVQLELLHKYGMENPHTKLHKVTKGWQFAETIEIRDPFTKQIVKKDLKPFMVDNLYQMLENEMILFSNHDEELYYQLISYIVIRTSSTGRPIFAAGGQAQDHAHDALVLACFAIADNYDELLNPSFASKSISVSSQAFMPMFDVESREDEEIVEEIWGDTGSAPVKIKRSMSYNLRGSRINSVQRKMF